MLGARLRARRLARTVVIVGSGVVGTATGKGLQSKGHRVILCDVIPERVAELRDQGLSAICTDELDGLQPDAYLISVPSPTVGGRTDLSNVKAAAAAVGGAIASHPGWPLVALRSTVPPGTTEKVVLPILESASGRAAGRSFGVCMNPEFLRGATADSDFMHPRVIVIGALDDKSDHVLRAIYAPWPEVPVISTSLRTAEATKYVANVFNATKISFFNEMLRILVAIEADPAAAFEGAVRGGTGFWDQWYGTRCGAPYGGACLPKDTMSFLGFVEDMGLGDLVPILRATIQMNEEMAVPATRHGAKATRLHNLHITLAE
jgi:UDPglucose 6-dehydrogenase